MFAPLCHLLANGDDWHGWPFAFAALISTAGACWWARRLFAGGTLGRAEALTLAGAGALATAGLAGLDCVCIDHALGVLLAWAITFLFAAIAASVAVVSTIRSIVRALETLRVRVPAPDAPLSFRGRRTATPLRMRRRFVRARGLRAPPPLRGLAIN